MRVGRVVGVVALAVGGVGCAPIPPPDVLRDIDRTRDAPSVREASAVAPVARAHADALVAEAHAALERGDFAGAQILGEQASAAFESLVAEARAVRAEDRRVREESAARELAEQLGAIDAENQRVAADIAAMEAKLEARAIERVEGAREAAAQIAAARRRAFDTVRFEARILCTAASLLGPRPDASAPAVLPAAVVASLAELDALDRMADPVPLDTIRRARGALASCRMRLEEARAATTAAALGDAQEDALVGELVRLGFDAVRTEQGIIARRVGPADSHRASLRERRGAFRPFETFGALAATYRTPLLLVARGGTNPSERVRTEAVATLATMRTASALRTPWGVPVAEALIAPASVPLIDPSGRWADRNETLEVVFVTTRPW